MIEAMTLLYLVGAVLTAGMTFALSRRWRDVAAPGAGAALLSVVAGVLWPLVVVGGLQIGAITLLVRAIRDDEVTAADYALAR